MGRATHSFLIGMRADAGNYPMLRVFPFTETEPDYSDDEDGYEWDLDRGGDLGNYEEE